MFATYNPLSVCGALVQVHFICLAHLQQPLGWPKCFTGEKIIVAYTENKPDKKNDPFEITVKQQSIHQGKQRGF